MKLIIGAILLVISAIAFSSCGTLAPKPTATLTPTATSLPTSTPTPVLTDTPIPTFTSSATFTQTLEPGYYSAPDNLYSLIPPEGWTPKDMGLEDPVLVGPRAGGFSLNLTFIRDTSDFGVDFYSALAQESLMEQLENATSIREDFLSTPEGLDYFRWEITCTQKGALFRQVYYFYGNGGQIVVITYTRLDNQGGLYDDVGTRP